MTVLIILLLILLGIILLMLEFAVIPGSAIAGVSGIGVLAYSAYLAFDHYGTFAGILTVGILITLLPILFFRFLRSKTGKKMQLDSTISGVMDVLERERFKVGDKGRAISRLAPMGKVEFNNHIVEGKSTGEFIDDGSEIEIVSIQNNKLIVKQIQQ